MWRRLVVLLAVLATTIVPFGNSPAYAQTSGTSGCSSDVFSCGTDTPVPQVKFGPPTAYEHASSYYPSHWDQYAYNQAHDAVFPLLSGAPSYVSGGASWAAPLTGDEFLRLARAFPRYGVNGGENWGSEAAQWLGNATGVSVADGIVYAEESNRQIWALDAATGNAVWEAKTVNANMGDPLVETINGQPVVFVAAGDVGFTIQNAVSYVSGGGSPGPSVRGANFSAVYAFNGVTGKQMWRFDTRGEAMPTPVYKNGTLFFNTGDGHLYAVNAATGALISKFTDPGFSSMSSGNWYETPGGRLLIIVGCQDKNELVAVDETNPASPTLAWEYAPPGGVNTGTGDVGPVVDQSRGLVITDALVKVGSPATLNENLFALDAATGALKWSTYEGSGPIKPFSFKGSVPMVHNVTNSPDGAVFIGDLLNQTYQSYDETTGALRWSTALISTAPGGPSGGGTLSQPRGGGVWWNGKVIQTEGRNIRTFDPNTGALLNDFTDPGYYADWGINSPVIVGDEMFLGSISGWVFAAPVSYVTSSPGKSLQQFPPAPLQPPLLKPVYYNSANEPTSAQQSGFPTTCLNSAGGQTHNSVVSSSLGGLSWQAALSGSMPLSSPPVDEGIFGPTVSTEMTDLAKGAGSGVCAANGILYVGSNHYTVDAINATTGKMIWSFATINANYGQPVVTPKTVVVSSGDQWFNFSSVLGLGTGGPHHLGASFQNLHGLDPLTGQEKWTFYTQGTDAMTPLYDNGNLYWVNGNGNVWAINADTGATIAPFEDSSGNPTLHIGGMNATDSANIYHQSGGDDIMVVGTADPNVFYGIDLATDTVLWKQTLPGFTTYTTGFSSGSPVVDQGSGLVIGDVMVNPSGGNVTSEAFALNAVTGAVVWTKSLGTGPAPYGYTAASPVLSGKRVFFADPVTGTEAALNTKTGSADWATSLGQISKAPGTVAGSYLIQPAGPDLYTMDTSTGKIIKTLAVGGSFKDNAATVVGKTLYIGNGWGWAMAIPLSTVT